MDTEVLPLEPNAFLVTCEPLIDKYARGLTRRAPAAAVYDGHEPLGKHHDRGMILPIAVAPYLPAISNLALCMQSLRAAEPRARTSRAHV